MTKIFLYIFLIISSLSFSQTTPTPNKILNLLESYKKIYPIVELSSICKINYIDDKPFSLSMVYNDNKNYQLCIYMDDVIEINYFDNNNLKNKLILTNSVGTLYCQQTIISNAWETYKLFLNSKEVYSNTISK